MRIKPETKWAVLCRENDNIILSPPFLVVWIIRCSSRIWSVFRIWLEETFSSVSKCSRICFVCYIIQIGQNSVGMCREGVVFLKTHTSFFSWHGLFWQLALVVAVSFRLFVSWGIVFNRLKPLLWCWSVAILAQVFYGSASRTTTKYYRVDKGATRVALSIFVVWLPTALLDIYTNLKLS